MAAVVEALARNKVVALLVPAGGVDARDIAALALAERLGAHAGERLAGAAQAVELGELLKAALFGSALVFIERERWCAERVRAVGAQGDIGVAGVVGNAGEVYATGTVEIGVFNLVDGGGGTVRGSVVTGVGRGGFGAIARVLAILRVRGARCSRFEPGNQVCLVVGAAGTLVLFFGQSRCLLIALRRQQLGRSVERPCEQRKPKHHGGADGKYLLVGGLARHGGS